MPTASSSKGGESLIIVMRHGVDSSEIAQVVQRLEDIGAEAHVSKGKYRTVIGAVGERETVQQIPWEALSGVERAVPVLKPYKFVSRDFQTEDTVVEVSGVKVGGGHFAAMAGPGYHQRRSPMQGPPAPLARVAERAAARPGGRQGVSNA